MLDADLGRLVTCLAPTKRKERDHQNIDASEVVALEPAAACLLASTIDAARQFGRSIVVEGASPAVRSALQSLACLEECFSDSSVVSQKSAAVSAPFLGRVVSSMREANDAANELAERIARFVPTEDASVAQKDHYGRHVRNAAQPALAYVLSELLDNVINHSRSAGFSHAKGWAAVQYYPAGDLMRLSVVDNGCGFMESMRGVPSEVSVTHSSAIEMAFQPFFSTKHYAGMYSDRTHMGLGLPVCRDLCKRLQGRIFAASGTAWVYDPGLSGQQVKRLSSGYQGAIVSLEFHRRGITAGMMRDVLQPYLEPVKTNVRFS